MVNSMKSGPIQGSRPLGGQKLKKSSYLIVVNFMSSLCMKAYSGKVGHTNLQYCLSYLHVYECTSETACPFLGRIHKIFIYKRKKL